MMRDGLVELSRAAAGIWPGKNYLTPDRNSSIHAGSGKKQYPVPGTQYLEKSKRETEESRHETGRRGRIGEGTNRGEITYS
jgi:hypothetical protein